MQYKITIHTLTSVTDPKVSQSFKTRLLAESAQNTLKVFGVETELTKSTKLIKV